MPATMLPRRTSPAVLIAAAALLALGLSVAEARAAAPQGRFSATLANPVAAPEKVILNGVLWRCAGTECVAPRDGSRVVNVCARLARKMGQIARFTTMEGDMAAEDLARCNGQG